MSDVHFEDNLGKLRGFFTLDVYSGEIKKDSDGKILNQHIETIKGENLITTAGKGVILDRLFGLSSVPAIAAMGVGTSGTAASASDTALTGGVFIALDSTPTRSGLVVTCVATFGTGTANITWAELALATTTGGILLLNRLAPIGPFTKSSSVSIVVTVQITQS